MKWAPKLFTVGHSLICALFVSAAFALLTISLASFHFSREDPSQLPYAAWVGVTAAALLAAWGLFVHLNRGAELLEPEAMESAKQEDEEVGSQRESTTDSRDVS